MRGRRCARYRRRGNTARLLLEDRACTVKQLIMRAQGDQRGRDKQQREAAQLRVIEELGAAARLLLSGYRRSERKILSPWVGGSTGLAPTPIGIQTTWPICAASAITLTLAQLKTQLTGRELDAALADPRWEVKVWIVSANSTVPEKSGRPFR
jgi:hypothetical protein